jgi:hypothetical protein
MSLVPSRSKCSDQPIVPSTHLASAIKIGGVERYIAPCALWIKSTAYDITGFIVKVEIIHIYLASHTGWWVFDIVAFQTGHQLGCAENARLETA